MDTMYFVDYGQLAETRVVLDGTETDESFIVEFPKAQSESDVITITPKPGFTIHDVAQDIGCITGLTVGLKSKLNIMGERPVVIFCHPNTGLAYFCTDLKVVDPQSTDGHFEARLARFTSGEWSPCRNGAKCFVKDRRHQIDGTSTIYELIVVPGTSILPGTSDGMTLSVSSLVEDLDAPSPSQTQVFVVHGDGDGYTTFSMKGFFSTLEKAKAYTVARIERRSTAWGSDYHYTSLPNEIRADFESHGYVVMSRKRFRDLADYYGYRTKPGHLIETCVVDEKS